MMIKRICECGCGRQFRTAQSQINKGWGRFYSKSCGAKARVKREGRCGKQLVREL
jgi:hypothetical protein